ncbi:MAG TPA: hypothetical protein GXX29_01900 [Firmicutes bacterium]|nr:hypothetical protein [Bacillota bacterium]
MRINPALLSVLILNLAAIVAAPGSLGGYDSWLSVIGAAGSLLTLLYIVLALRRSYKDGIPGPISWIWLAVAVVFEAAALSYQLYLDIQWVMPFYPTAGDILWILSYIPLGVVFLLAIRRFPAATGSIRISQNSRLQLSLIWTAAIAALLLMVMWILNMLSLTPFGERLMLTATFLLNLFLLLSVIFAVKAAGRRLSLHTPFLWVVVGALLLSIADASFLFTSNSNLFNPALDFLWLLAFSTWIWGASLFGRQEPLA